MHEVNLVIIAWLRPLREGALLNGTCPDMPDSQYAQKWLTTGQHAVMRPACYRYRGSLFLLLHCEACFLSVVSVDELIQSSDSETEDLVDEPVSKKTRRAARDEKRSKAWLKEDEDIIDFLDPAAARKVVGKVFLWHFIRYIADIFDFIFIFCW